MSEQKSISRRNVLKLSSAAFGALLARDLEAKAAGEQSGPIIDAARKVGKLPRVRLGSSNREVSIIIGAGDMEATVAEAGILCGMNYWHKANRWMGTRTPESISKNRDAHYCQVTVDRVGGNHYTGHFDEEEHVAYVKLALEKTGLGYFDDMQLHYGYHNVRELKSERAFVRAFERLKKAGLVRHLCLSQHGYAGNARVPGGESAAEVLTAVMEDGWFEHAQFIYSYGADPEMDRFMELARRKGFGTIAMKTARGIGRMMDDSEFVSQLPAETNPFNALVRWLTTETKLDAVVIRTRTLEEFSQTCAGAGKKLRPGDRKALELMIAAADRNACRLCTLCQPHCPAHVPIAEILRFERYAVDDQDWRKARILYHELPLRGDACTNCGACLEYCPQHLDIPRKLEAAHRLLFYV